MKKAKQAKIERLAHARKNVILGIKMEELDYESGRIVTIGPLLEYSSFRNSKNNEVREKWGAPRQSTRFERGKFEYNDRQEYLFTTIVPIMLSRATNE